jgi:phosphatidylethanolamine/phosphatidyl-N-methylethanolamine N-methyltransferase
MESSAAWLGWHPNFPYSTIGNWLGSHPDACVVERSELPPMKLFTLLRIVKAGGRERPSGRATLSRA